MSVLKKVALTGAVSVVAVGAALWFASAPQRLNAATLAALGPGDVANGEQVFFASGCASCHAASGASGEERLALGGGMKFETGFGTFVAPNISQHPTDGIGNWSVADLANAMMRGVSPEGEHYYPAFPYASYARMKPQDVADLHAFMQTLPAVEGKAETVAIPFPFNQRRGIGLWKAAFLDEAPVAVLDNPSEQLQRGQYLVESMGHCAECHTPRNAFGALDTSQWMAGAAAMETGGRPIPNITASDDGIGDWTEGDIAELLSSGFTPEYDSVGGTMAAVVRNISELDAADREAMAAYLKAIPAHPNGY
ncbi:cytochrome c [Aerobium aerolatum]|uniref:Cytochrome c, mono-and diheme variants n=1 Tax=Aquamicrobium aerolatum DSM 21857 TaxID=1121003 RepID=A0A1I3JIT9_9HYPH|nr:cytochrome c [Aquamicrobium aerolatum]SFI60169.1 Cytochrome c, mono-and diheme variants [Aquamicrobium aerolatum DSM 21857]